MDWVVVGAVEAVATWTDEEAVGAAVGVDVATVELAVGVDVATAAVAVAVVVVCELTGWEDWVWTDCDVEEFVFRLREVNTTGGTGVTRVWVGCAV